MEPIKKDLPNWIRFLRMWGVLITGFVFMYRFMVKLDRWLWSDS